MSAVAHEGPITTISALLTGEMEREVKQLLHQGYVEVYVPTKELLRPQQFCRAKTRSGSRAEEQWKVVKCSG
ncbi:MAG: hypothetical protein JWR16_2892 [Nevskia sp.]|nr:hypothetical protein [Nevskia sp.]